MRLVVQIEIENDILDGPSILRAIPAALGTFQSAVNAEVYNGSIPGGVAPEGFDQPVFVKWRCSWMGNPRGYASIPTLDAADSTPSASDSPTVDGAEMADVERETASSD
jgi:hypothetical protein